MQRLTWCGNKIIVLAAVLAVMASAAPPRAASAVSPIVFTVNSTADVAGTPGSANCVIPGDSGSCTLRAAIMAANHTPGGGATVIVPAGTYLLTIPPSGGDDESTGDLNITNVMTLQGAGYKQTIISASGLNDRVLSTLIGGPVVISGVTIEHGTTNDYGGGVSANASPTILNNVRVKANQGDPNGGGIYNSNRMIVANSIIDGNTASTQGGGIYSTTEMTVTNSTVLDNSASEGAGIYNYSGSPSMQLMNSTVSGNMASGNGGGIYNSAVGNLLLYSSTVANNQAGAAPTTSGQGGGIYNTHPGTVTFANSIVANNTETFYFAGWNTVTGNCYGTLNSLGYNMLDAANCTISGGYDLADPLLGPLRNNGGATPTLALLPGSPAINAGNPSGCNDYLGQPLLTDQRGWARIIDSRCDIGAYETTLALYLPVLQH